MAPILPLRNNHTKDTRIERTIKEKLRHTIDRLRVQRT